MAGRILYGLVTMLCIAMAPPLPAEDRPGTGVPGWLDEVQTYCMVPVLPERALQLHVSVNGVWGGMGGTHPVLTHTETVPAVRERFAGDGRAFIEACHEAGFLAVGSVNGLEGFQTMREAWPGLEKMACRNAGGGIAASDDGMMLMCTNNPDWVQWEIDFGKQAIGLGADMILIDTPMSSSFIAGFLGGGFCPHCLEKFEKRLRARFTGEELEENFDLEAFDRKGITARLKAFQFMTNPLRRAFLEDSKDARLFREFVACQEEAGFETRKTLVDALRGHAKSRSRKVAFCTNAADLGTGNPGGHWIRGLMFADLFDLFVYEQNCLPYGMPFGKVMKCPRGKWAAYHKLAHAIHHRRSAAVLHAHHMGALVMEVLGKGKDMNTWMAVQSAEAYAANGAYVQYYIEPKPGNTVFLEKCWAKSAEHAAFVQSHKDLYQGGLQSGAGLAFLFLFNERGRSIPSVYPSYLGFAQALIEGNCPFDVVFGGDGRYVKDRLTAGDLRPYGILLVPGPIEPTGNQKRLVQEFVEQGGTLLCQEAGKLGFSGDPGSLMQKTVPCLAGGFKHGLGRVLLLGGAVTPAGTGDMGSNFFKTYSAERRKRIIELAEWLGHTSILEREADGLVCAFPIVQPERNRLVVHLVNYDIDHEEDTIRAKKDVTVNIPRPPFLPGRVKGRLCIPGKEDESLSIDIIGDTISFSVPCLGISASVAISGL